MTSGFEGRPNDPSMNAPGPQQSGRSDEAVPTERIHRRPPEPPRRAPASGPDADDAVPTQAIRRTDPPNESAQTEMFHRRPPAPGRQDWAGQDAAAQSEPTRQLDLGGPANPAPPHRPGPGLPQREPGPPGGPSGPRPGPPQGGGNMPNHGPVPGISLPPQTSNQPGGRPNPQGGAGQQPEPTQWLNLPSGEPTRQAGASNQAGAAGFSPDQRTRQPNPGATQAFSPHDAGWGRQPEQPWQLGVPATGRESTRSAAAPPSGPPTTMIETKTPDGPPPGRNRKAWIFAGVGAAVVVAAVATLAVVAAGQRSDKAEAGTPTQAAAPSMISALTSTGRNAPSTSRSAPTTTAGRAASSEPLVPGFQTVQVPERGAAYDIPKDWKIEAGTSTLGQSPDQLVIAGLAQDGKDYCPRSVRTNSFLTMSPHADPAAAAADIGMRMVKIGWPTATGAKPAPAEQVVSLDGQLHGSFVETTGGGTSPAPGCAKTFAVYTFAFPSENGNFVIAVTGDTGIPKAVDKETAKKIVTSIRPLPNR
ncbi:hypothetical protein [Nocardia transvalensis]|uniref:hypothetical protein n=1 Tax=Nocardia transvalensis TaxID=37333 RepID=UPI0018959183|nr:hypothetical protein [Nocardia transvalensis]MBF6333912.1 hypothetical protein [Nocardia transvalensis]